MLCYKSSVLQFKMLQQQMRHCCRLLIKCLWLYRFDRNGPVCLQEKKRERSPTSPDELGEKKKKKKDKSADGEAAVKSEKKKKKSSEGGESEKKKKKKSKEADAS